MTSDIHDALLLFLGVTMAVWLTTTIILFKVYKIPFYHVATIYQVYHFFGFIYRPLILLITGNSDIWELTGVQPSSDTIMRAIFVVNIAHLSFFGGFIIGNRGLTPVPLIRPYDIQVGHERRFQLAILIVLLLGTYSSAITFGTGLSLEPATSAGAELDSHGGYRLTDVSGYQTVFSDLIPISIVILLTLKKWRKIAAALAVGFFLYRISAGHGRSVFVALGIAIFALWTIARRVRMPPKSAIAASLMLLVVFDFIGSDRNAVKKIVAGVSTGAALYEGYVERRSGNGGTSDMEEFDGLTSYLEVLPSKTGWSYGTDYLRLLVWPIPRAVWHDKPVLTSSINFNDYGYFIAMTLTLYIESYSGLGYFSLILFVMLAGFVSARFYLKAASGRSALTFFSYLCFIMYCFVLFRDGWVSFSYLFLVAVIAVFFLTRSGRIYIRKAATYVPRPIARIGQPVRALQKNR